MSVPHVSLTASQHRLLAELAQAALPSPSREPAYAAARGLDPQRVAADVPDLLWMKLVSDTDGLLSLTLLGAAVFHRAAQEEAERRLADVSAFAAALESRPAPAGGPDRAPYALRKLAQGEFSLDEALSCLS
ncbi:hypothetical protein DMB38_23745 [Streptomyces sp. WAC 06738]|uniref:hypothetical protein n=1 Tax=Streptomyces sp. WAC 06738 TaxID=2203210 RepID=UPI000F71A715|nr:hypothetical protein [Streptomyces sp. WAC 06738]AZM48397.1 hypothetical protein DMB38_23745 [Streptomyces sp. WAC 06738]